LEFYATADEYFSTFVDPVSATNPNKKKKKKPKRKKGRSTQSSLRGTGKCWSSRLTMWMEQRRE
jgi:hypothetical protein